jgi:hypothetical protein
MSGFQAERIGILVVIFDNMKLNKLALMAVLGLTMSALSSYAAQVTVIDVLNLSGAGPVLNTNSGGGNQHVGSTNPIFSYNGDFPRITFQRSNMGGNTESYLVIYPGLTVKNQAPPSSAITIAGSDSTSANPPDLTIDFGSNIPLQALFASNPSTTWSIAVVEVTNSGKGTNSTKTDGSFQFNFPNMTSTGVLGIKIRTQAGSNGG